MQATTKRSAPQRPATAIIALGFAAAVALGMVTATAEDRTLELQLRAFLDDQATRVNGRVEVTVGKLDPRITLAPCRRVEAFMPANRLFRGSTAVGLRCKDGANWNVSIPVNVRVFGVALVASRAIQANQPLHPEDFNEQEVELSQETGVAVTELSALVDRTLMRAVAPGTTLRQEWLRAMPVIQVGDQVRLSAKGPGFLISSDGQALTAATDGQSVKIRTDSGRVITAIARPGRLAEVQP